MINDNTIVYKTSSSQNEINIGSDVDWGVMPSPEILRPDQKKNRICLKKMH